METYYKATRMDGTTRGGVRWEVGRETVHPSSREMVRDDPGTYLSLSVEPGETLIGGSYPCRLFRVVPTSDVITSDLHLYKRCALSSQVIEELPGNLALGPNGTLVDALLRRLRTTTRDELDRGAARFAAWGAAWFAAWDAAWDAARFAAWDAARFAAWDAAWFAAWDAARFAARDAAWDAARFAARNAASFAARDAARGATCALVVCDLISDEHFRTLTDPLFSAIGDVSEWGSSEWGSDVTS